MTPNPTHVALLTPPGRGALATICVRGPQAQVLTSACLVNPSGAIPRKFFRPWLCNFRGAGGALEELVVVFLNEQEARIHCHGGAAACDAVINALVQQGAQHVPIFAHKFWACDLSDESLSLRPRNALSQALTERTALILLDQLNGAWMSAAKELARLSIDDKRAAVEFIDQLLARAPVGLHLTGPWQVVIAGRPNAGKSSLLNALVGFQRSITSPQPGTTRDVVTARTAIDGWPVELRDTAGLRSSGDAIESLGVELAEAELIAADLVLYLIPSEETAEQVAEQMREVSAIRSGRPLLVVRTKLDLHSATATPTEHAVSAQSGAGLPELMTAIIAHLIPVVPPVGVAVPFLPELVAALVHSRMALASA